MTRRKLAGLLLGVSLTAPLQAQRRRSAAPKSAGPDAGVNKDLAGTFHGTLKELTKKEIALQTAEDQTVVIRRSRKTKFFKDGKEIKAANIALDTAVSVDAIEDIDLKPIAVTVTVDVR